MRSQQTFTCSKSTRESLEVDVILMSLFLPLNIIHTIFESLLLTLNWKIFIWTASSDYETTSIDIYFFQTIKRCCQVHVQTTLLFKIISIGMFCVYMIKGDDALTEIHFNQPGQTVMRMLMYQFKLTKSSLNLFLSRGYEHVPSLARWNRFYINTEPACLWGYFFSI